MTHSNRFRPQAVIDLTRMDRRERQRWLTTTAQPQPGVLGPRFALAFTGGVVAFVVVLTILKLGQGGF